MASSTPLSKLPKKWKVVDKSVVVLSLCFILEQMCILLAHGCPGFLVCLRYIIYQLDLIHRLCTNYRVLIITKTL